MNESFFLNIEFDTEYMKRISQSQKIAIFLGVFSVLFPICFFFIADTNIVWKYIILVLGLIFSCICYVKTRRYTSAKILVNYFCMHVFDDRIEFVGDNDSLLIIPYASIKYCTHGRFESETIPGTINSFVKIKTQKMLLQLIDIYFKDQGLAQKIFNIIKRKTSVSWFKNFIFVANCDYMPKSAGN